MPAMEVKGFQTVNVPGDLVEHRDERVLMVTKRTPDAIKRRASRQHCPKRVRP